MTLSTTSLSTSASTERLIEVLIVDDSALVRMILTQILDGDPGIEVVGTAPNPYVARDMILELHPHVITLDVEMPRMDGLAFLERLMTHFPLPVVMVSSLTQRGCETTLQAMELGAVDIVAKPALDVRRSLEAISEEVVEKVYAASKVSKWSLKRQFQQRGKKIKPRSNTHALANTTDKVIAIGASTGGTEAIKRMLMEMPANAPGTIIVQHMPPTFTTSFAKRLNELCAMTVAEARGGERVIPGSVLLAPGDKHMMIRRSGGIYSVSLNQNSPVNRHRPSVEVLFQSVAKYVGRNAVGVMLTGMGADGAEGMKCMRDAGAHTIGQDEASCVVYGMPKEAKRAGAVIQELPIEKITGAVLGALR